VNAPLFATFLLGMFWRRATGHGAFFGLLAGTIAAAIHHGMTLPKQTIVAAATSLQQALPENLLAAPAAVISKAAGIKGGWLGFLEHVYPSEMAQNFWTAIWAWSICFLLTILISLATRRTKTDQELTGLVFSLTPRTHDHSLPWWKQPVTLGLLVLAATLLLNILFW
jgi:SSS family solute:Na+ symporter